MRLRVINEQGLKPWHVRHAWATFEYDRGDLSEWYVVITDQQKPDSFKLQPMEDEVDPLSLSGEDFDDVDDEFVDEDEPLEVEPEFYPFIAYLDDAALKWLDAGKASTNDGFSMYECLVDSRVLITGWSHSELLTYEDREYRKVEGPADFFNGWDSYIKQYNAARGNKPWYKRT